jgi:hypothetical protein
MTSSLLSSYAVCYSSNWQKVGEKEISSSQTLHSTGLNFDAVFLTVRWLYNGKNIRGLVPRNEVVWPEWHATAAVVEKAAGQGWFSGRVV